MIQQFLQSILHRPPFNRMVSYVVILFSICQICIPLAARATYRVDSCCGNPVERGRLVRIPMPDPSKVVPSDLEITYQLNHLTSPERSSWSKKMVQPSDKQIHFQFQLDELKRLWENGKAESDLNVDRLFRFSSMKLLADLQDADYFMH